ncbi:MAG TPA: EAL domain-containing protein [Rhodocyclaceae bacterium]|jgi:diguanylate cyclase (GGDEF)-like protein/PAS domain S-box-containing protein
MKLLPVLPLRLWLPLVVLGCYLLSLAVSVVNGVHDRSTILLRDTQEILRHDVARLTRLAERGQGSSLGEVEAEIAHLSTEPTLLAIFLTDAEGRIVLAQSRAWIGQSIRDKLPGFDADRTQLALQQRVQSISLLPDQRGLLGLSSYALPAQRNEVRSTHRGLVVVTRDMARAFDEATMQVLTARIPELAGAILVAILMASLLRRAVTRPLDQLNNAVAQLAAGQRGVQVQEIGPPEVVSVARGFNEASRLLAENMQTLTTREAQYRSLMEVVPVGIFRCTADGSCVYVNEQWCEITGLTAEDANGNGWQKAVHVEDRMPLFDDWNAAVARGMPIRREFRFVHSDGHVSWVVSQIEPERDGDGHLSGFIGSVTDITEHRRAEAEIEWLAYHDFLTNLPNRRLFLDRLATAINADRQLNSYGAVLQLDLDHFKHLNDARGHALGDRLLTETAQRLGTGIPATATFAHFDGDTFAVLLPGIANSLQVAARFAFGVAESLRQMQAAPIEVDGEAFLLTASIGISLFPKGDEQPDDLLKEADTAMYRAKAGGRNTISFFEPSMQIQAESRFTLESNLREALGNDELRLYLQPQVDAEGRIVGAEALVRWQHPEKGLVPPGHFIPLAEESGLIVPLGEWVLAQACSLLPRCRVPNHDGSGFRIAVNVSPRQFRQTGFVQRVREILQETGADPRQLTLEVTEGLLIDDIHETIARMTELQSIGVEFAIDDFGTGYSSLAYLKRLPVRELKIDRAFVQDAPRDPDDAMLVEAMLSVARHLSLTVVAEGVETEAQAAFLKARGCDLYQGYLYGHPEPAEILMAKLSGGDSNFII